MASRFEIILDTAGKYYFHLRGPDGGALLASHAFDSKIMAQSAVMNARSALKDETRVLKQQGDDGKHCLIVRDKDGTMLARSPGVAGEPDLEPLCEAIRGVGIVAPVVDLTKRRTTATTS